MHTAGTTPAFSPPLPLAPSAAPSALAFSVHCWLVVHSPTGPGLSPPAPASLVAIVPAVPFSVPPLALLPAVVVSLPPVGELSVPPPLASLTERSSSPTMLLHASAVSVSRLAKSAELLSVSVLIISPKQRRVGAVARCNGLSADRISRLAGHEATRAHAG